jgi:NAD(P)-dependent dehydrogenase (short-subunit alcohol dehydrogenase family)
MMTNAQKSNNRKSGYGQTVLVTGASSGIGLSIARLLLVQGFTVLAASRSMPEVFSNLIEIEPALQGLVPLKLDVTDALACEALISEIIDHYGELAAIFHCAGSGIASAVEETMPQDCQWQMDQLFFGTVNVVRPALPVMRRQGKGLIVMISSVAAYVPVPFQTHYSAAKAAVSAFAAGLADEMAPYGVRICTVSPGDTKTGYTAARRVLRSNQKTDSPYATRLNNSVERMARDEQNGMDPTIIARAAVKNLYRENPPLNRVPGLMYKVITVAWRILPTRLFRAIVRKMYA